MKKSCTFYLARHGQTEWNVKGIMQGHLDSPLTDNGIAQARKTSELLKHVPFSHAYSSDLGRARRTAELIVEHRKLPVVTHQALRESKLGPFEGKSISYFQKMMQAELAKRAALSSEEQMTYNIHADVENYHQQATRVLGFLTEAASNHLGSHVLVVSHAGAIRSSLVQLGFATNHELGHGNIDNTGYAVIETDGKNFAVTETYGIQKIKK